MVIIGSQTLVRTIESAKRLNLRQDQALHYLHYLVAQNSGRGYIEYEAEDRALCLDLYLPDEQSYAELASLSSLAASKRV